MSQFFQEFYLLIPIVVSMVIGVVLGLQRVHWGKAAGPRTYAIVAVGSTLFTLLSLQSFGADTARVAAGIVTGIGFLGAGMILQRDDHIEGLTTAAGMWMVAAIGMAIGCGYYVLGIATTLIVLLLLMFHEKKLIGPDDKLK